VTLQTHEEQEILHRIQRIDRKIEMLERLVEEVLNILKPKYHPPIEIIVIPAKFD